MVDNPIDWGPSSHAMLDILEHGNLEGEVRRHYDKKFWLELEAPKAGEL